MLKLTIGDAAEAMAKISLLSSGELCPCGRFAHLSRILGDLSIVAPGAVMRDGDSSAHVFVTWIRANIKATPDIAGNIPLGLLTKHWRLAFLIVPYYHEVECLQK